MAFGKALKEHLLICMLTLIICSCNKYSHHVKYYYKNVILNMDYNGDTLTNKYVGEITAYYPSGELNSHYKVINDTIEGVYTSYYKNGNKKFEVNYRNGKRDGIEDLYYENGQVEGLTTYRNNLINGVALTYYQNHKLQHYALWKDSFTIYWLEFCRLPLNLSHLKLEIFLFASHC